MVARGTISGIVVGAVVSAVGIGTAALVMEPVALPGEDGAMVTFGEAPEVEAPPAEVSEASEDAVAETAPETAPVPDPEPLTEEDLDMASPDVEETPDDAAPDAQAQSAGDPTGGTDDPAQMPDDPADPMEDDLRVEGDSAPVTETAPDEMVEMPDAEDAEPAVDAPDVPEPTEEEAPEVAVMTPEPMPQPESEPDAAPEPVDEEAAPDNSMPAADETIVTGRLPSVGAEEAPESDGAVEEEAAEVPQAPAIERNAIPYTGDPALPKMSVVLIDQGPSREDVGDLAVMPFPLSVAVDASAPDAEAAMQFYRDAGAEVVLMVPLPTGATPADVDVTFQVYEPLMADAVAVLFPADAGFQSLGGTAVQVATVLGEEGLGLVTYPEGLNTGHKSAVKEGVPAGMVFRDLDSEGQAPDVMRRFLDNVAFRARADEGVIAIARVRSDSLQALLEWSLGNRAQTVNLAPVSAVLMDQ